MPWCEQKQKGKGSIREPTMLQWRRLRRGSTLVLYPAWYATVVDEYTFRRGYSWRGGDNIGWMRGGTGRGDEDVWHTGGGM
jgi:hypothetical protein